MEENSRVVRMTLTIYHIISLMISFFILFAIVFSLRESKFRREYNNYQKVSRPYIVDKILLLDKTPFAWRVGFTLSLLNYSQEQVNEFIEALETVLKDEKRTFDILEDHKNSHLSEFLKLNNKETTNSIKEFQDLLTSHSIMNDTEPKSSLDVVLYRSIHKFIEDRIWKAKLERENMTPPGEAPF
jgi:hypothetical protein